MTDQSQPPEPPPYGQQPPYGQPGPQYQPYGAPPPGYGPPAGYGYGGPVHGVHPVTGAPYSDKSKVAAAVLQIVVPLGIGRFYTGHTGLGVAQLLVTLFTCGIGALWPFIDGIMMLVGEPTDAQGRPLRP